MAPHAKQVRIGRTLIVVLLAAIAVYAAIMVASIQGLKQTADKIEELARTCIGQTEKLDLTGGLDSLRALEDEVAQADEELSHWYWDLASVVPVFGGDVSQARELVDIAHELASKAMLPPLEQSSTVLEGITNLDIDLLFSDEFDFAAFRQSINDSHETIRTCTARIDAMPPSHFDKLDELKAKARTYLGEANDVIGMVRDALDLGTELFGQGAQTDTQSGGQTAA